MRTARMDRRVRLERLTVAADAASGQPVEQWDLVAEVWADVVPVSGDERWGQQQVVATADTQFRIRWRRDITPLHRIRYDDRDFDVLRIDEVGRRDGLLVWARARAEVPRP